MLLTLYFNNLCVSLPLVEIDSPGFLRKVGYKPASDGVGKHIQETHKSFLVGTRNILGL